MAAVDTHIILVTLVLVVTLILLISEKVTVDKTAIGIMVVLAVTNVLSPPEAVAGFANPAVITVAAMFLLSRGLIRTGAVDFATRAVMQLSGGKPLYATILVFVTVGAASAFINNTPVVVLFIPIVMALSCEYSFSPSKLLIPLSYVSILAGTSTLIGTSTNIIVSDLAATSGYGQLTMFELGKIGVPIALVGTVFLLVVAPRLMPDRTGPVCELDHGKAKRYIAELIVPDQSPLIGIDNIIRTAEREYGLNVIEVFRNGKILDPARRPLAMQPADILLVKGSADDLLDCLQKQVLELAHGEEDMTFAGGLKDDLIIELVVPPASRLLRAPLLSTVLQHDPDIRIIAIRSRRSYYSDTKVQNVRLKIGDIILIRCPRDKIATIRNSTDFVIIEDIHHAMIDKEKAGIAASIFAAVVAAASLGLADIMTCSLAGVLAMALTHCFSLKDAYRSLQSEVLLLIVGTIALGLAMQKTGATELYARLFLGLFQGLGPEYVLVGILALTSICTHLLSNNATAVLLLPIALSTAAALGVDPKPFIIGVCFGASACYASPIGYQTNLLVYSPGGYRFSDYVKLGLPLNLLVISLASILIPRVWPF